MPKFSYADINGGTACYFAYAMDGTENARLKRKNVYLVRCSTIEEAILQKDRFKSAVGHTGQRMNTVGTITRKTLEHKVKDYFRKNGMVLASVRSAN